ncbi:MAG: hypothetical protein HYR73_01765 [Candidatus Eisenbacteria bacterium]|nr:hypothetical protein [Candidatus Eisenbacteria bacterium]
MTTAFPSAKRAAVRSAVAQAWVERMAGDPEAVSALGVARAHLAAGRNLTGLRRLRVFELWGGLAERGRLEDLLHRSTQFYNPYKERCTVRLSFGDPAPVASADAIALVVERGGERRSAAERWWLHETGEKIEVREGVAWVMSFAVGESAAERARELTVLEDRRHGLFCNPHSQDHRVSGAAVPLPWIGAPQKGAKHGG